MSERKAEANTITPPQTDCEWFVYLKYLLLFLLKDLKSGRGVSLTFIEKTLREMQEYDEKNNHVCGQEDHP